MKASLAWRCSTRLRMSHRRCLTPLPFRPLTGTGEKPRTFHGIMDVMSSQAASAGRKHGVGRFGRQPVYWILRERGVTQVALGSTVGRTTSFVNAVLNGSLAPEIAFVTAISDLLVQPKEALFTEGLLEASRRRDEPRLAHDGQARRARIGRFGRQPAYWILRERQLHQSALASAMDCSQGYVSEVLNGSRVPDPSFVDGVAGFLGLTPVELFTEELIEASRARHATFAGPPPTRHVGPYGRQPAYWMLRERRIPQDDLGVILGRSGSGHVSKVLNGFLLPDRRFVEAASDVLLLPPATLFTEQVLKALQL